MVSLFPHMQRNYVSTTSSSSQQGRLLCPKCRLDTMQRDHRNGFLERVVFPWFHLYPWECPHCRTRKLLKSRGIRRKA